MTGRPSGRQAGQVAPHNIHGIACRLERCAALCCVGHRRDVAWRWRVHGVCMAWLQGDTAGELVHDVFASPFLQALLRAAAGDK